ncbi:MAG: hypothetical protein D6781_12805 [Verrucomicrobia bacterium]|nr:MAG: hypothetical protein D6781_12805 [Verrucomicrobiota bacterium]
MTTQDLIERIKRYPIVCGSVIVLIACFLAYYFRMDLISDLEARHDEVAAKLMRVEHNLVAGTNLEEDLEAARAYVAKLEERVVRPSELALNLKYFYQFESETGVSLADLRQLAETDKGGKKNTVFRGVGYSAIVSGTFHQIVAYFDELESGPRIYRLKSFTLQRGRETAKSTVNLSINLELLGWPR